MEESIVLYITVFVLAMFLGFELINRVPPTLHTPLMSGTNAISGITIVGAILSSSAKSLDVSKMDLLDMASWGIDWSMFMGFLAVIFATINVIGGFLVTDRMLRMFRKR